MSLRFDRKGSLRLRSSFSCRSRTDREASLASVLSGNSTTSSSVGGTGDSKLDLMSWSYRQSKFACDYLNLMDPPHPPPLKSINGVNPYKKNGIHLHESQLAEADLCQCDHNDKSLLPIPLNNYNKNVKIGCGGGGGTLNSKDNKCINNMKLIRRASTVSITPSYASSTISSDSSCNESYYSDLIGLGSSVSGYGFGFNNAVREFINNFH